MLQVWLIEINASPDFSFSSVSFAIRPVCRRLIPQSVTEDLVRKVSDDYIKVVVDYAQAVPSK